MKKNYLKDNRIEEILGLIQTLFLSENAVRNEDFLIKVLQGNPKSANSWTEIIIEHPEFFRFNSDVNVKNPISLIVRNSHHHNSKIREPLSNDVMFKLFDTAMLIFEKQKKENEKWKFWIPIIVIVITGILNLFATLLSK